MSKFTEYLNLINEGARDKNWSFGEHEKQIKKIDEIKSSVKTKFNEIEKAFQFCKEFSIDLIKNFKEEKHTLKYYFDSNSRDKFIISIEFHNNDKKGLLNQFAFRIEEFCALNKNKFKNLKIKWEEVNNRINIETI